MKFLYLTSKVEKLCKEGDLRKLDSKQSVSLDFQHLLAILANLEDLELFYTVPMLKRYFFHALRNDKKGKYAFKIRNSQLRLIIKPIFKEDHKLSSVEETLIMEVSKHYE